MMTIESCCDSFENFVRSYSADDTVVYYRQNLMFFRVYLVHVGKCVKDDINTLKKSDFVNYIAYHKARGVKNTSVRTYARAIKVFLRYCYNEGYMLDNITQGVKYPKSDKKLIEPLTTVRVNQLFLYLSMTKLSKRDTIILRLMLDCGLRRSEVINLDVDDIHFAEKYISVVNSKNNSSRVVPLPDSLSELINEYINTTLDVKISALLLDSHNKERITKSAINKLFSRMKQVDKRIHPHLLRHTFGTSFILGGGSLEVLRVLMGHTDYNVTKEYLHIASQSKIINLDIYKLDDIFFRVYNYNKE